MANANSPACRRPPLAPTDEQIGAMRDPMLAATTKRPRIGNTATAGGFLAGCPENTAKQRKAVDQRCPGLDRVLCATSLGTRLDVQLEDLDRFAKEVLSAFHGTKRRPARGRRIAARG